MRRSQKGFSLLELLIVVGIGSVLFTAILSAFASTEKNYRFAQGIARIQENGRIAMQWLTRDVRMAGYIDCQRMHDVNPSLIRMAGWHAGKTSSTYKLLPATILQQAVKNSDILLLQAAAMDDVPNFTLPNSLPFADCQPADSTHAIVYYVRKTNRLDPTNNPIYALYRRDLNGSAHTPTELVEGVDNMQILFGIKNSTTQAFNYFSADQVPDWNAVSIIQITLLLDSMIPNLRREWKTSIALREP